MIIPAFAISFILTYLVENAIAVGGVPKGNIKSKETPMAATTTVLTAPELNVDVNATTIGRYTAAAVVLLMKLVNNTPNIASIKSK